LKQETAACCRNKLQEAEAASYISAAAEKAAQEINFGTAIWQY
jgi:hypothetical protein